MNHPLLPTIVVAVAFSAMALLNGAGYLLARYAQPGRNRLFGIRTAVTLRSESAWRASQVAGWRARLVLVPVYVAGLVALGVVYRERQPSSTLLIIVVVVALFELVVSVLSVLRAQHAAHRALAS